MVLLLLLIGRNRILVSEVTERKHRIFAVTAMLVRKAAIKFSLNIAVLLIALLTFVSVTQADAPSAEWWDGNYSYREKISVTAGSTNVPTEYSVRIEFDHAALVAAGKSLSSGDDIRIVYWNGSTWTELDRRLDDQSNWDSTTTQVWFRTQAAINADETVDDYYLYYGYGSAGSPPATWSNVFLFYDDFNDGSFDTGRWTCVSGTCDESGGNLTLGSWGKAWATASYAFGFDTRWETRVQLGSDFAQYFNYCAAANTSDWSDDWIDMWSTSSAHQVETAVNTTGSSDTYTNPSPTSFHVYAFNREGASAVRFYQDTTQIGFRTDYIPGGNLRFLSNNDNDTSTQIHDWVRVRKYVSPEPATSITKENMCWSSELLTNPGFESGSTGWTSVGQAMSTGPACQNNCDATPHSGSNVAYWTDPSDITNYAYQTVDLSGYASDIDAGNALIDATGWFISDEYSGPQDQFWMQVKFYDGSSNEIVSDSYDSGTHEVATWTQYGITSYTIPVGARSVEISFDTWENPWGAGSADDFSVKVGTPCACSPISFDAASNSTGTGQGASISWSHTVTSSGSDRILVVGVSWRNSGADTYTVDSVNYNSLPLDLIRKYEKFDSESRSTALYYLTDPPTGSPYPIQVNFSGTVYRSVGGAVSLTGVDQSDPVDAENGVAGALPDTNPSVTVTTNTDGAWVVDALCVREPSGTTSVVALQAERWNYRTDASTGIDGTGSTMGPKSPAGDVAMSWTTGTNEGYSMSAVALKPACSFGGGSFNQCDTFNGFSGNPDCSTSTFGNWTSQTGSDGTDGWATDPDSTGSSGTGPGTPIDGAYLYLESSASTQPCGDGVTAGSSQYVESNTIDASSYALSFEFDWNMNVNTNTDASLHVDAWNGSSWDLDVNGSAINTGNNTDLWVSQPTIDLSSYTNSDFKIRIRYVVGTLGNVYQNDVAVDNLCIYGDLRLATLGDGTDPGDSTVAPGSADQYLDQFTFAASTGTDSVTALTVTTANTVAIASMEIWNDTFTTKYFTTVSSPAGDDWNFSGGTPIPVTTSTTPFRIRFTAKDHGTLTEGTYAVTGTVTSFTSTNAQTGSDTDSATVTIDNLSPGNVTGAGATPGDTQVTVSWSNPGDGDFSNLVVLRNTATISEVPSEGSSPAIDSTIGTSVVRYISSGTSFIDTGLTNGQVYFYRIFAKDTNGNYSATGVEVSATPAGGGGIAFRSADSDGVASGNLTINKPTGTVQDDVMIGTIGVRPETVTITPPSGWTLVRRIDNANANANSLAVYYKVAGASEPASYTWTISTNTGAAGGIQTFSGVDTTNPIDVENGQTTASGLLHATPSVVTTVDNAMLVTSHTFSSATTWTPPTGMTEGFDVLGGLQATEGNYVLQATAGATGEKTATAAADADVGNAHILALTPAAASGGGLFQYRKPITIPSGKVSCTPYIENFPLLINITDSDLIDKARDDGHDIVFRGLDDNVCGGADTSPCGLYHEVERWNSSTGELIAWVRIPRLYSAAANTIYMYYGNPNVTVQTENAGAVWDNNNYVVVQHMHQGSALALDDSTANNNDVTTEVSDPAYQATGQIGYAVEFDGNDAVEITDPGAGSTLDITAQVTVSAWIRPTAITAWNRIVAKSHTANVSPWTMYGLLFDDTSHLREEIASGGAQSGANGNSVIPIDGSWTFATITYDHTALRVYVNGSAEGTPISLSTNIDTNDMPLSIGRSGFDADYFTGRIDEVRVSNIARQACWIGTEYSNQNDPGDIDSPGFYTVGGEEAGPATAVDLVSFTAKGAGSSVLVEWETAQELNHMGFYLYRSKSPSGSFTRLTDKLISGLTSSVVGRKYSFEDKGVTPGEIYYYKLEDLDIYGKKTHHGPICVDWDGDGLPDDWEIAHGLNPGFEDADLDWDGDGLTNLEEYLRGTDPFNPDTDGDGILMATVSWMVTSP